MSAGVRLAVLLTLVGCGGGRPRPAAPATVAPQPPKTGSYACRYVDKYAQHVATAAKFTLRYLSPTSLKTVAVNRSPTDDALTIEILGTRTEACDAGPDVSAGCVAKRPGNVQCAAGAIAALTEGDETANPALLFVLAHEVGHLAQSDDDTAFSGQPPYVDGTAKTETKLEGIRRACQSFKDGIARERDADDRAMSVLEHLLNDPSNDFGGKAMSGPDLSNRVRLAAMRLEVWLGEPNGRHDRTLVDRVDTQHLPSSPGEARKLADASLCYVLGAKSGRIAIPVFRGDHPDPADRLSRVSAALMSTNPRGALAASHPGFGVIEDLTKALGAVLAESDVQYAQLRDWYGTGLCTATNEAAAKLPTCP